MVLPLDMPDDYIWQPGSGKSQLADLGELAVRLGSPVTYDRRGTVYWLTDFEEGIEGTLNGGDGTGWEVRATHHHSVRGYLCARLTGGSTGNLTASVGKRLSPALFTTYGLEVTFSCESDLSQVLVILQYNDGTTRHYTSLQIVPSTGEVDYRGSDGNYHLLGYVDIDNDDPDLFYTVKIVSDLITDQWVRVLFNQTEFDMTGIDIYTNADASQPRIEVTAGVISAAAHNGIAYIDSMIVTVGDP